MTYNQAPDCCDECAEPVTEDDAAPTCGAHRLHQQCAESFRCRECDQAGELDIDGALAAAFSRLGGDPFEREGANTDDPFAPVGDTYQTHNEAWREAVRRSQGESA